LIPDLDIYWAARLPVDQYGEDAAAYAAGRVEQMLEGGDIEGVGIGRAIMAAIEELQRGRLDGESVN
jgi:DNA-binding transcriptional regulator LsrR (DeoR family)